MRSSQTKTNRSASTAVAKTRVVLGIDPGLASVGYGCLLIGGQTPEVIDAGVIETPAGRPLGERLTIIDHDLRRLISQLQPDLISLEKLFFNQNVTTGIEVAGARGVILMVAHQAKVRVVEPAPSQIKLALTGWGRASKTQMRTCIKQYLKINPERLSDDCADALAAALVVGDQLFPA